MERMIKVGDLEVKEGYCTVNYFVKCDAAHGLETTATDADVYRILDKAELVTLDEKGQVKAKHGGVNFYIIKR